MGKSNDEPVHLCPICVCVEMEFKERIKSDKWYRLRRFKCPVCDHEEMYKMSGTNDLEREYNNRAIIETQRIKDKLSNEYKRYE